MDVRSACPNLIGNQVACFAESLRSLLEEACCIERSR